MHGRLVVKIVLLILEHYILFDGTIVLGILNCIIDPTSWVIGKTNENV